ncbi:hypothetical protein TNCV_3628091 [Trichonephila clavipes]|nr:hypothetical protein TNCV_3628091 [Trichonephila clavipes]
MTSAGKKKSNGAKGMQHSSGHITDFIGIKDVMAAVGVYAEENRGNTNHFFLALETYQKDPFNLKFYQKSKSGLRFANFR